MLNALKENKIMKAQEVNMAVTDIISACDRAALLTDLKAHLNGVLSFLVQFLNSQ